MAISSWLIVKSKGMEIWMEIWFASLNCPTVAAEAAK